LATALKTAAGKHKQSNKGIDAIRSLRLTPLFQIAIRAMRGESKKEIARDFAISLTHVRYIAIGKSWADALPVAGIQFS
jgi:hypothetical protein